MKAQSPLFLTLVAAIILVGALASNTIAQDAPMKMPIPTQTPSVTPKPAMIPATAATPTPTPPSLDSTMKMDMTLPSLTPVQMDPAMKMPAPAPTPGALQNPEKKTLPNLSPAKDFPEPVADSGRYGSTLVDILEFRTRPGGNNDFRWDMEGSYGGDRSRFWYKSEGERNTAFKAEYDIDLQLLYGRLISPYFNFQTGVRLETQTFRGANVTRPQAVVGFEGLLPYLIELESAVFIDPKGHVSGRASLTRDLLFTNRLIMQARFETNAAVQRLERFTTGRGLNNIETGLRLRYEFSRKFAPYIGVTFDRSFFGTASFVRLDGGDPSQVRLAMGVRLLL